MIDPQVLINIGCTLIGALVGILVWRSGDKRDIGADAAWRATVDAMLKNVKQNTQQILCAIDKSDIRIRSLEDDVLILKKDVSDLKEKFEEGDIT